MTERISARQFHDADGVDDWRVLFGSAATYFQTGSFAQGVALVDEIGRLADAADHHPDVDLRYPGVGVRLSTHSVNGLSDRDIDMARKISTAAHERGIQADPSAVQDVNLTIDALVTPEVLPFWQALLGYNKTGDEDITDPGGRHPGVWFQDMDPPRFERNHLHVDVRVPHDQANERVAAAVGAGGRLITDEHAPAWWVLADAEGNQAYVATWQGRD